MHEIKAFSGSQRCAPASRWYLWSFPALMHLYVQQVTRSAQQVVLDSSSSVALKRHEPHACTRQGGPHIKFTGTHCLIAGVMTLRQGRNTCKARTFATVAAV